jgi:hypothetical protein
VLALNGSNGSSISSYSIRQAVDSASYCLSIAPLPIGLIYFKASMVSSTVLLHWKVDRPDLLKNFIVEKWNNGHWISLKTISASNNTTIYNFTDEHPVTGSNLYRLKLIRVGNAMTISPARQVIFKTAGDEYVVYPNPATDEFTITGTLSPLVSIRLSTIAGKVCWEKKFLTNGNKLMIHLPGLPAGTYLLHVNEVIKKLVISK